MIWILMQHLRAETMRIMQKNNDAEITAIPEITETPDAEENKNNIFDRKDDTEDKRPQNAATDLTETEKEKIASQNHTCDGITVSGIDLPMVCTVSCFRW